MRLKLDLTRNDGEPVKSVAVQTLDRRGMTIGRGANNDWTLEDPDRHMSKNHCVIEYRDGQYLLTDTSTNGVFLNRSPERLLRDSAVLLSDGDVLGVGVYEIAVQYLADDPLAAEADDPFAGLPPPYEDPVEQKKKIDLADTYESPDEFVKTLDAPDAGLVDDEDPFGLAGPAPSPRGTIDDGLDPFAGPPTGAVPGAVGGGARDLIPDDADLIGPGYETGAEHDLMEGHSVADHVRREQDYFRPPQAEQAIPDDWEAATGGAGLAPQAPPPGAAAAAQPTPPGAAAAAQPTPPGAAAAAQPPPPPSAQQASGPGDLALVRAFLAGAGMKGLDVSDRELEELMRTVGATFRQMVEGMREVLMTRSSIKSEFRIDQTMLKAKENNPLKFSTSGEEAMKALLQKPMPGYLPAERAVQEGFEDIRAHQIAVMAGLQVALTALLKRFDPETLAKRLEKNSLLGSKKARYWDVFTELYEEIAREAEDDFQSLFGREFSRAYTDQVKKL